MALSASLSSSSVFQILVLSIVSYIFVGVPLLSYITSSDLSSRQDDFDYYVSPQDEETVQISLKKFESLVIPDPNLTCYDHSYRTYVYSRNPLVIYVEGFLSEKEIEHLVDVSEPLFTPSLTHTANKPQSHNPSVRKSLTAQPPRSHTVQCIESRARSFQGYPPYTFIEKLWTQKYEAGGHYRHHYDWGAASREMGRVSSFMVWLGDECEEGGTSFPRLRKVWGKREGEGREWCRFVDCANREPKRSAEGEDGEDEEVEDGESGKGVIFKPIKGNAVYWENFNPSTGRGYEESWHAGLPVKSGTKIGLNIWSWYQRGYRPSPPGASSGRSPDEFSKEGRNEGEKLEV